MKKILLIFVCLNYQMLFSQTATAPSAGDGTTGSPYQIASLENLYWIAANSSRWAYHYLQTADVDASSTSSWSGGGWIPIGGSLVPQFTGTYDGGGHSISGLYISRSEEYQGLFGFIWGATISNLGLRNISVTGGHYTGGLVGRTDYYSTITNCYAIGNVSGSWYVGGLVADNQSSTVSKCYTAGTVTGGPMIGGLVGTNQSGSVINSYSRSNIIGGTYEIGGLVGLMCYSAIVSNCYSTGGVSGPNFNIGGLIGRNYSCPPASNCFWDNQTSGMTSSAGGSGKTTSEMKMQLTFTSSGWDFTGVWEMINVNYPRLINTPDPALPVELISFDVSVKDNKVNLTWKTMSEVNNYGFEVQRSTETIADDWQNIGLVVGHGNSNSPKEYSFIDYNVLNARYYYRLKQIDTDGSFSYSDAIEVSLEILPSSFNLFQNFPNPFNPSTLIQYTIPKASNVKIEVFNVTGENVATLVDGFKSEGYYEVNFDASSLPSGIYFYRLQSGNFIDTKKMILLK